MRKSWSRPSTQGSKGAELGRRGILLATLAWVLLAGCPMTPTTSPETGGVEGEVEVPIIPVEPANKAEGDDLHVTIPLVGADPVELADLVGQPVL